MQAALPRRADLDLAQGLERLQMSGPYLRRERLHYLGLLSKGIAKGDTTSVEIFEVKYLL